ncbi:hypothetical protein BST61_g10071 [Cercospora zeina]
MLGKATKNEPLSSCANFDIKLIPWLTLLYLISFLDRTNIGNAKIDGLGPDLGMTQGQCQACLSIFFVSYSLFEPLANILLEKFRPSVFLTGTMILWGHLYGLHGPRAQLRGSWRPRDSSSECLRLAGFPGVNYYLSCWYQRSEFGIRAGDLLLGCGVGGFVWWIARRGDYSDEGGGEGSLVGRGSLFSRGWRR